MATAKRLSGEDAEFYYIDIGSVLVGDNVNDVNDLIGGGHTGGGYLRIAAKAVASHFNAALSVDDIQWSNGLDVVHVGDNFYYMEPIGGCDVSGWTLSGSKSEIDTTTFCDLVKAFRSGKTDLSGTLTIVHTTGGAAAEVTERNKYISQFITLITDDGAGAIVKNAVNDTLLWVALFADEETVAGNIEEVYFLPIRLTANELSAALDAAEGGTVSFRVDGAYNPVCYQRTTV